MGKSGFTIIESGSGPLNSATNMITDFLLPNDYPDDLMTFLQISMSLSESAIISIIRDGTSYPINSNQPAIGDFFRSIPIQKGEVVNVQLDTTQTILKFKIGLEE